MDKFMFNERFGLQSAAIDGTKTDTRRIEKCLSVLPTEFGEGEYVVPHLENDKFIVRKYWQGALLDTYTIVPRFKVGDVVAIAQRYSEFLLFNHAVMEKGKQTTAGTTKGWNNKMFVKAELMPNRVEITNVRLQRLQDISDEDCLREGIKEHYPYIEWNPNDKLKSYRFRDKKSKYGYYQLSPVRDCFAEFINRVSGKGTWERNPWVLAYSFKRIENNGQESKE